MESGRVGGGGRTGESDYKSQILPNFKINCLRTLQTPQPQPTHILKGYSSGRAYN